VKARNVPHVAVLASAVAARVGWEKPLIG